MDYVAAILPSAGVTFLFWLAIRAVFQADRRERAAEARERRAERQGHAPEQVQQGDTGREGRRSGKPEVKPTSS